MVETTRDRRGLPKRYSRKTREIPLYIKDTIGESGDQLIEGLKAVLRKTDLAVAAQRCGVNFDGSKLTLKILGKKFSVDSVGKISSDIHVNSWIVTPFLDYVVGGKGKDPVGKWISFRELNISKELS